MHRMRRVRRGLSKWIGNAFHGCEGLAFIALTAGPSGARESRAANGQRDGCRRIRQLHQYIRMRSGLPRRNQRQLYRQAESRIRTRGDAAQRRRIEQLALARNTLAAEHRLVACPFRQPAETLIERPLRSALVRPWESSASCRRQQAGSLCSPDLCVNDAIL